MARFHITAKGTTAPCTAQISCRLGGDADHFDSAEAAQQAYEERMADKLMPETATKKPIGLGELNKLAKEGSDPEVLLRAVREGSDRTLKILAKNPNLTSEVFDEVLAKADLSLELRELFINHEKVGTKNLTPQDLLSVMSKYKTSHSKKCDLLASDDLTDAHLEAFITKDARGLTVTRITHPGLVPLFALGNPNNKLTEKSVVPWVENLEDSNSASLSVITALKGNHYPPDRLRGLPSKFIWPQNCLDERNPAVLEGFRKWADVHTMSDPDKANSVNIAIAQNRNASNETLSAIATSPNISNAVVRELLENPKTSAAARVYLRANNNFAQRLARIENLKEKHGDLKGSLIVEDKKSWPSGRNRGYSVYEAQLDLNKVNDLGIDEFDLNEIMGSRGMGGIYNPATGIWRQIVDSTD
jgi:hypothetical protein